MQGNYKTDPEPVGYKDDREGNFDSPVPVPLCDRHLIYACAKTCSVDVYALAVGVGIGAGLVGGDVGF